MTIEIPKRTKRVEALIRRINKLSYQEQMALWNEFGFAEESGESELSN